MWSRDDSTPIRLIWVEHEKAPHYEKKLNCFKQLLEAGCDPTLCNHIYSIMGQFAFVSLGVLKPLRSATNICTQKEFAATSLITAQPFVNATMKLTQGSSLLHEAVRNSQSQTIKFLVDKGSDVDSRNDRGMTPLQCQVQELRFVYRWYDEFESIKCLITHGADIHAMYEGKDCSTIAYENRKYGSYAGDLWDMALVAICNQDLVNGSRRDYAHEAAYIDSRPYGVHYTVEIFKQIWEGMEDQCPYYVEATTNYLYHDHNDIIRMMGEWRPWMGNWLSNWDEPTESDSDRWETESESENEGT